MQGVLGALSPVPVPSGIVTPLRTFVVVVVTTAGLCVVLVVGAGVAVGAGATVGGRVTLPLELPPPLLMAFVAKPTRPLPDACPAL